MVDLKDAGILALLPTNIGNAPEVRALDYALRRQVTKLLALADGIQIWCSIDTMPDYVLDYLGAEMNTPSYSESFSIETKRELVKNTPLTYIQMGTPAAVKRVLQIVYDASGIEEWFEYDGEPHYFRLYADITNTPTIARDAEAMERTISQVKRISSWLERISYMVRHVIKIGEQVELFSYTLPVCGAMRCGTWPHTATTGHSEQQVLRMDAQKDAFTTSPKICGTWPHEATSGYTTKGTVQMETEVGAYNASPAQAGESNRTGTLPTSAAGGYTLRCGMMRAGGTVQAYTASPATAGSGQQAGTLPQKPE